jgi:hypothetical protein
MSISLTDMATFLETSDAEVRAEEHSLFGTGESPILGMPQFRQIVAIMTANPLLVSAALTWLQQKQSEIAMAQLKVLYTPEQLEVLLERARAEK